MSSADRAAGRVWFCVWTMGTGGHSANMPSGSVMGRL
jgi:hypothetical protein